VAVVCITGGSGFIGSHLARAIPGAHLFDFPKYDLRNIADACAFIDKYQPDVVYHLAAQALVTNDDDYETISTNVTGTYNLLHACRSNRNLKSFVHISTDKVYGDNCYARTIDPLKGVDHPYNASKLCGDVLAQNYMHYRGMPIRIIRTGNIYGAGDTHWDRLIPGTIKATMEGRRLEMRSDGNFARDYIYIDDLIPAYLHIAKEAPGIYNLGGRPYTAIGVVKNILELMGREDLQPVILNNHHNEIPYQHVADCPDWWKAKTDLKKGLKETIKWHSNQA